MYGFGDKNKPNSPALFSFVQPGAPTLEPLQDVSKLFQKSAKEIRSPHLRKSRLTNTQTPVIETPNPPSTTKIFNMIPHNKLEARDDLVKRAVMDSQKILALEGDVVKLETDKESLRGLNSTLLTRLQEKERLINEKEQRIGAVEDAHDFAEKAQQTAVDQIKTLRSELESKAGEIRDLKKVDMSRKAQARGEGKKITKLEKNIEDLERRNQHLEEQHKLDEEAKYFQLPDGSFKDAKQYVNELEAAKAHFEEAATGLENDISALQSENDRKDTTINSLKQANKELKRKKAELALNTILGRKQYNDASQSASTESDFFNPSKSYLEKKAKRQASERQRQSLNPAEGEMMDEAAKSKAQPRSLNQELDEMESHSDNDKHAYYPNVEPTVSHSGLVLEPKSSQATWETADQKPETADMATMTDLTTPNATQSKQPGTMDMATMTDFAIPGATQTKKPETSDIATMTDFTTPSATKSKKPETADMATMTDFTMPGATEMEKPETADMATMANFSTPNSTQTEKPETADMATMTDFMTVTSATQIEKPKTADMATMTDFTTPNATQTEKPETADIGIMTDCMMVTSATQTEKPETADIGIMTDCMMVTSATQTEKPKTADMATMTDFSTPNATQTEKPETADIGIMTDCMMVTSATQTEEPTMATVGTQTHPHSATVTLQTKTRPSWLDFFLDHQMLGYGLVLLLVFLLLFASSWAYNQGSLALQERNMWMLANNRAYRLGDDVIRRQAIAVMSAAVDSKKVGWMRPEDVMKMHSTLARKSVLGGSWL